MSMLTAGASAPDFTLANQRGEAVTLSQLRGRWTVLYFYPKAMTPGCTTQACGIRDINAELAQRQVTVLAVSPDPVARLARFASKHELDFDLLSDEDLAVSKAYGAWGQKKFMGREYMGILRSTFLINPKGEIAQVFAKVNTKTHHQDILAALAQFA